MEMIQTGKENIYGALYTTYQNDRFTLEKCDSDISGLLTIYSNTISASEWLVDELTRNDIEFEYDEFEGVFTLVNEISPDNFENEFQQVKTILEK